MTCNKNVCLLEQGKWIATVFSSFVHILKFALGKNETLRSIIRQRIVAKQIEN